MLIRSAWYGDIHLVLCFIVVSTRTCETSI